MLRRMTDARVGGPVRAWIWGGALLIASVVLRLALSTMLSFGVGVVAYAVPLWAGRADGSAYVCRDYTCQLPATTPEALAAQL